MTQPKNTITRRPPQLQLVPETNWQQDAITFRATTHLIYPCPVAPGQTVILIPKGTMFSEHDAFMVQVRTSADHETPRQYEIVRNPERLPATVSLVDVASRLLRTGATYPDDERSEWLADHLLSCELATLSFAKDVVSIDRRIALLEAHRALAQAVVDRKTREHSAGVRVRKPRSTRKNQLVSA